MMDIFIITMGYILIQDDKYLTSGGVRQNGHVNSGGGRQQFRWMRRNCGLLWKIVVCLATKPVQASEHPEPGRFETFTKPDLIPPEKLFQYMVLYVF